MTNPHPLEPTIHALSPEGRLTLGYTVPDPVASAPAHERMEWLGDRIAHTASHIQAGTADTWARGRTFTGYDIVFFHPTFDAQADRILQAAAADLTHLDIELRWEATEDAAPTTLEQIETNLAHHVGGLITDSRPIVVWSTHIGDNRQAGLFHLNPDTNDTQPYTGDVPAQLDELIADHKNATYLATGRTWLSLTLLTHPTEGYRFLTDPDAPHAWATPPTDADYSLEHQRYPAQH